MSAVVFNSESMLTDVYQHYCDTNPRITSEQTAKRYFATLISFEKFLDRPAKVQDLNSEAYGAWCKHRRDVCGVAPSTLHGEAQKFCVLWRWLARRRECNECNVVLPRKHEKENSTWLQDEFGRIEKAGRECTWFVGKVPGRIYWPALLGVAVESGERLGALHQLQAHHFDLEARKVLFPANIRKGKMRDLTKPLSEQTVKDVEALLAICPQRPFAAVQKNSMYHPMRRLLCDAGLPSDRSRMFHCLRRYHATQVTIMGGNATRSLDHSDPRITNGYVDKLQLAPEPMVERPQFDVTEGTDSQSRAPARWLAASMAWLLAWFGR